MNSDAHNRLEIVLDREIQMAEALTTALAEEKGALVAKSPSEVVLKSSAKLALLADIEALERERTALWPAAAPANPALTQRWQALMTLMTRCRAANEVNGYIITLRRSQVGQLLAALRGGAPTIYGPHGKTFGRAQRTLATA